jgi:hypothetical protein
MRNISFFIAIIITTVSFGQINDEMYESKWKIGQEKEINGVKIKRLEGKNESGITNVVYHPLANLLKKIDKDAETEMWTPEQKQKKIDLYNTSFKGGRIDLYIERSTIGAANTEYFTIIIKDSKDSLELFRQDLKSKIPSVPSRGSEYWSNYKGTNITQSLTGKFYIYIIDKLGNDENKKFKFEVTF